MAGLAASLEQGDDGLFLLALQGVRIVRMIEDQALGHLIGRPFEKFSRNVGSGLEAQGTRAGQLHRPADPVAAVHAAVQRLLAVAAVEQGAESGPAVRNPVERPDRQLLEFADPAQVATVFFHHLLELYPVVDGEGDQRRPIAAPRGRPMDMVQGFILAKSMLTATPRQEIFQLGPTRHRRRAAVARHGEGAAGVGEFGASLPALIVQPAAQEATHEGVPGAEHVVDLDREAGAADGLLDVVGDVAGKHHAAHGAALADDGRVGLRAYRADGLQGVRGAAGDVQFLLGADNQVAERQDRLQVFGHCTVLDVALLARAVAADAPEHGPVIDVEGDPSAILTADLRRLARHRGDGGGREMSARENDGSGGTDEVGIDVVLGQRHVGAVLAVEDEREGLLVADPQDDQRGQAFWVGLHTAGVDALAPQLLDDETAHMLITHSGDDGGLEA